MTRPVETWRVCGHPVDYARPDRGCTCHPGDPTHRRAAEALARLDDDDERRHQVGDAPQNHRPRTRRGPW